MTCFDSSTEHLLVNLERIDLLVRAHVAVMRAVCSDDPAFQGLFITEQQVQDMLTEPLGRPCWEIGSTDWRDALQADMRRLRLRLAERERLSTVRGDRLRLLELSQRFELNSFDVEVILVCLAPEIDLRYGRLFAYLQDDVAKKRPSIDLVLNLLCHTLDEKLVARRQFAPEAPLLAHRLIEVDDRRGNSSYGIGRPLRLDPRIVNYLLEVDGVGTPCRYLEPVAVDSGFEELVAATGTVRRLQHLCETLAHDGRSPVLLLSGSDTHNNETAAKAVCRELGLGLLRFDGRKAARTGDEMELRKGLEAAGREARLRGWALYFRAAEHILQTGLVDDVGGLLKAAMRPPVPVFIEASSVHLPSRSIASDVLPCCDAIVEVYLPLPDYEERVSLWERALAVFPTICTDENTRSLAGAYRLSVGQIKTAVQTALNQAEWRCSKSQCMNIEDVRRACRLHSSPALAP